MAEDNQVDLVAQLPDEMLMEIFGHLPSLRDKLRLESVNSRFQRCLLELMRTRPIPFTFTIDANWEQRLNGYCLLKPLPEVLQSLGKKAKFNSLDIDVRVRCGLDSVLSALVSSDIDCLDKVTTFKLFSSTYCRCNETLLKDLFAKCTKLSQVQLKLAQGISPFTMNLGVVLKDKALTQLSANLSLYTQELVIQMFQSIKPNTLQKIDLCLSETTLNMDILVTELRGGGWSALEEMDILFRNNVTIDTLFSSLNQLPQLQKCNLVLYYDHQLVNPALTSLAAGLKVLFANQAEITVDYDIHYFFADTHPTGCEFVALIRQVQSEHPELKVGFGPNDRDRDPALTLTLGKVSFKQQLRRPVPCNNAECPQCRIFYPTVLYRIVSEANRLLDDTQQQEVHLATARLDRCSIDSVADHLNEGWFYGNQGWKALKAEMNEARDLATVTFQSNAAIEAEFKITVDCGHCLNNNCFACLHVG